MFRSKTKRIKESPVQSFSEAPRDGRGRAPRRLGWIVGAVAIVLLVFLLFGLLRRHHQQKTVQAAAHEEEQSLPIVNVDKVKRSPAATSQLMPGNMTPLTEAYIYARANGYVKKRYADIGDRVKQGQLLAEIEAPDLDQQVQQARAAVAQAQQQVSQMRAAHENAKSQEELAHVTWERYKVLLEHGAVSKQDADQQYTNYRSALANVDAAQANINAAERNVEATRASLQRMIALQEFEHVRAPFSGVITARNFDVGALVGGNGGALGASTTPLGGTQVAGGAGNAGASGNSGSGGTGGGGLSSTSAGGGGGELFRVAQIGTLRILVNVPQESAPSIRVGNTATVFVQEYPNMKFPARITRTSNAIDLITRTLLTEVDVNNPNQMLLPGTYAQVQIENVRANPPLLVPGDSIIAGAEGVHVAVLGDIKEQGRDARRYPADAKQIHLAQVQVGRDYGAEIEIIGGLHGWEYVVVNPSDAVQEGAIVKPAAAPRTQGNQPRRGPSDQQPGGPSAAIPGKSDTGGRGASEKPAGGGKSK